MSDDDNGLEDRQVLDIAETYQKIAVQARSLSDALEKAALRIRNKDRLEDLDMNKIKRIQITFLGEHSNEVYQCYINGTDQVPRLHRTVVDIFRIGCDMDAEVIKDVCTIEFSSQWLSERWVKNWDGSMLVIWVRLRIPRR